MPLLLLSLFVVVPIVEVVCRCRRPERGPPPPPERGSPPPLVSVAPRRLTGLPIVVAFVYMLCCIIKRTNVRYALADFAESFRLDYIV